MNAEDAQPPAETNSQQEFLEQLLNMLDKYSQTFLFVHLYVRLGRSLDVFHV
jgi:hypothetical protein